MFRVSLAIFAFLLLQPQKAQAWGPEWITTGSYVHQIAHLLFAWAMIFFILHIRREQLRQFKGFRYLSWAAVFFVIWNLDAVVGHFSEWALTNPVFLGKGLGRRLLMYDPNTWLFYFTQINHFLFLPIAFYLFYRGLKAFSQEPPP
jgi:hypothetical protein